MTYKEYAELAFNAYSASTGGKTYDGKPIPKWNELPERIQQAWEVAVHTVFDELEKRVFGGLGLGSAK